MKKIIVALMLMGVGLIVYAALRCKDDDCDYIEDDRDWDELYPDNGAMPPASEQDEPAESGKEDE